MAQIPVNDDALYDEVHALGLTHLRLLAQTAEALRSPMADLAMHEPSAQEALCTYTHHLLMVSAAMLRWSAYLVPKPGQYEEHPGKGCEHDHEEDAD